MIYLQQKGGAILVQRIIKIRKHYGLNQEKFAEKLNLSRSFINQIEVGKRNVSDRTIADICREFNVSEEWLRTGEGEMFVRREPQPPEALLVEMLGAQNVTEGDRVLMKNFLELSDASRQEVIAFVRRCALELSQVLAETSKPETSVSPDIAARMEELERKNQELAAKVAAIEEEDSGKTTGRTG